MKVYQIVNMDTFYIIINADGDSDFLNFIKKPEVMTIVNN